jgi:hypothetical protein
MNLNLIITSKYWSIQPQFSTTVYNPLMMKTWKETMENILKLLQQEQILVIAPKPLESLNEIFSTISQKINYKNIDYSIIHLQPTNTDFNQELFTDVLNSIEFECAGLWFVVLSNIEPQSDFIKKILQTIDESNHFINFDGIEVELLVCVADGKELLWLNPHDQSEISINKLVKLLETHQWKISLIK